MNRLAVLLVTGVLGGCASTQMHTYKPLTVAELERVPETCEHVAYVLPWLEQHTELTVRTGSNRDLSRVKYKLWKLRSKCS